MINLRNIADGIPNLGYIIFTSASLFIFGISFFFSHSSEITNIGDKASIVFLYVSLGIIIKNTQFHRSKFYRLILISISFLLISSALKILHVEYSGELMIVSFAFALLSYSLYFINKKNKTVLDYLKWLYFSTFILIKLITINHYLYFNEIWVINFISTVLVVILIYIKYNKTPNWLSQ